ncbi:MAG: DegT/DnrJ/EryC1/StrS family aminotransferase [Bacteroides sp.]|nr:DegT/DnrJ/EryC1/StrS family aminotransferase [Bacteroides sp.]
MIRFLDVERLTASYEPELSVAVSRVVASGKYIAGNEVKQFEHAFAAYCGTSYCVGTANGFDALTLIFMAYRALEIVREGDEVIVPANAHISAILAVWRAGLAPVLCEPSPQTYNLDVDRLDPLFTSRTCAVLVSHRFGRCMDMEPVISWVTARRLLVIEDAGEAQGALYQGRRVGSLGDAAAFSFLPDRNLGALGNGGAVTTADELLAVTIRAMLNYGVSARNLHPYKGLDSRLEEIQAAVLSVKLHRLDADNERRRQIARRYIQEIDLPFITLPQVPEWEQHVFHVFPVFCPRRDMLQAFLREKGIETAVHDPEPPHCQGALKEFRELRMPLTEQLHREELSLPVSAVMTDEEVSAVIRGVMSFE